MTRAVALLVALAACSTHRPLPTTPTALDVRCAKLAAAQGMDADRIMHVCEFDESRRAIAQDAARRAAP